MTSGDEVDSQSRIPGWAQRPLRRVLTRLAVSGPVSLGQNVRISRGVSIRATHGLQIGDSTRVGPGCIIEANGTIGARTLFASRVLVVGRRDHAMHEVGAPIVSSTWIGNRDLEAGDIVSIGRDVWIGAGAIILSGVSIGDSAVIAAGSVVINDVAAFSVVAGNPARSVSARFRSDSQRAQHSAALDGLDEDGSR